jgi:hypothetical protein
MKRKRMLLWGIAVLMLAAAVGMSGCGMLIRKGVESATGVKVDEGSGKVTVTGKDGGTATMQEGKVPDGLPSGFPVYAGTVKLGNKVETPEGTSFQISIETPDDAKTVGDWYAEKLKGAGWTVEARNDANVDAKSIMTLSAKSGEKMQTMIIAGEESSGGATTVNVTLMVKP